MDQHPALAYAPQPREASFGHSAHWGLASLLMGAVVLILVPLFLLLFITGTDRLWNNPRLDAKAMQLTTIGSTGVVIALVALGVLAFLFGIAGIISAVVRGQPAGLPLAGTLMSLAAMAFAIVLFLATLRLGDELKKNFDPKRAVTSHATHFGLATGVSASLPHSAQLR